MENTIEQRINKNRDEIDKLLHSNLPLDLIYIRIRMLAADNETLLTPNTPKNGK